MRKKWDAIRGSAEFYVTMAVCLVVIGVSGYLLLFDNPRQPEEDPLPPPPADTAVTAPAVVPEQPAVKPPVVETLSPEAESPAPVMPEAEIDDTPVAVQAPRLIVAPLTGEVAAAFSVDALVYSPTLEDWRTHDGIDIAGALGESVLAACSGTVRAVTEDPLMGTQVVIDHEGGYQTTYANLQSQPPVAPGDAVSAGQIVGAVGDTAAAEAAQAPHLHFSVTRDGKPMDPAEFLQ